MLHDVREFIKPCVKQIASKFTLPKMPPSLPPTKKLLAAKGKIVAFRLQWKFIQFPPGFINFDVSKSSPIPILPVNPLTDLTCQWVKVCGATFSERICSQPQWTCYALPFSSTCSASTGRTFMLGVYIFCDGNVGFVPYDDMWFVWRLYMFESSFENVIVGNSQHMSHVTCCVLWLFFFSRPFWFKPHHMCKIHFWNLYSIDLLLDSYCHVFF